MILVILSVLLVCTVYLGFQWRLRRKRLLELAALTPTLPGYLPVVGNALVFHGDSTHLWEAFKKLLNATTEAGGVMAVWLGPSLNYLITDPDDAVTITNKCLEKNRYIFDMGNSFLGGSLINSGGSRWKHHRKLFNPSYSQHMLDRYQPDFNHQAKELVKSMEPLAGKGQVSIWLKVSDVTVNTVCTTVLGVSKGNESLLSEDFKAAVRVIFAIFAERIAKVVLHPEMVFKISPLKRTQDGLVRTIRDQSAKIVAQRKAEREADKANGITRASVARRFESFLDLLLDFADDDLFSDREIQDELNTLIATGYDTLSTVIPYTLMLIGTYPEVQKKLYEEIMSVVGPEDDVNKYHELPYLDAVFKESVRLFPPVPIISRDCNEELQLKNYKLPAGCHCTIGLWAIQRLPMWGPDAEQFRPERWLDPESLPKSPGAFCSFSLGKRNCLGKFYSTMFTKTVLVHAVRRFQITANIYDIKFKYEILMKPVDKDRLTFESFLDLLLDFADEDLFNDREVQDEINTLIATGYDTLSTSIPYTLMLIGTYPKVQRKLYEEITSVLGPEDDLNKYHGLPYLDAVFKESMRLFPPVPVISRDCNEELQLKNYKLPAGCSATIGVWAVQRLPIWGPDAEQFRPERWLDAESLPKNPGVYCAFSLGKRNCLGKFYSIMFTKTVLAHVVRRFHITANIHEVKFKYEILMKPAVRDRLTLELR